MASAGLIHIRDYVPPRDDAVELRNAAEAAAAAGPKRRQKGTSRLGLLAMFVGIAACVLCRSSMLPASLRFSPTPPAAVGLALALLAMMAILFGSRARAGVPLLAILICLAAIGISAYQGGARDVNSTRNWAYGQVDKYKTIVSSRLKDMTAPPAPRAPANPAPTCPLAGQAPSPGSGQAPGDAATSGAPSTGANPSQSGTPANTGTVRAPAADPDDGIGAGTIFDMRTGASHGVTGTGSPAAPVPPGDGGTAGVPLPVLPGSGASPVTGSRPGGAGGARALPVTPRALSAQTTLQMAQGKVKATEDDFRFVYAKKDNPEYLAAKAEVQAAEKGVEDAKRRSDGYGQPLIDATRQRKEAQEKVARIINDAMATSPAVVAARRELAAAEEALRQAMESAR